MLKRKQLILLVLVFVLSFLVWYVVTNKDQLIREHLTSAPPSLESLNEDLKKTKEEVKTLSKEFHDLKDQASAQAQEAAAAKASLAAIH